MGGTTQYTVNNQMVNATLMNIADNPCNVQLPGVYNKEENPRVPVIVTGESLCFDQICHTAQNTLWRVPFFTCLLGCFRSFGQLYTPSTCFHSNLSGFWTRASYLSTFGDSPLKI